MTRVRGGGRRQSSPEAKRAAALLNRDGHVIVKNVLDAERLAKIRAGLEPVIRKVVELDPERLGNRGSHRYSFGNLEGFDSCITA